MADSDTYCEVVIVGGGFSGLATAASLKTYNVNNFILLEKGRNVGNLWTGGLDSLCMHTPWHGNPYDNNMAFEKYPIFKTKKDVTDYLTDYKNLYNLNEHILSETAAEDITFDASAFNKESSSMFSLAGSNDSNNEKQSFQWTVKTNTGKIIHAKHVVISTGMYTSPSIPYLDNDKYQNGLYKGIQKHSWNIKNGKEFKGKNVLIVGSGNSAAEVAVECYLSGAETIDMLAGSPRYYIPKENMKKYYTLLMLYYKLRNKLSKLMDANHIDTAFDDLIYSMTYENGRYNSKEWCDAQLYEDRFQMLMSKDLSGYGLPLCKPLQFGESAYERFHVLDITRKGLRAASAEEQAASSANDEGKGNEDTEVEVEASWIELVKQSKVNIISGCIDSFYEDGVIIDRLLNNTVNDSSDVGKKGVLKQRIKRPYDAIIYATGFSHDLGKILPDYNAYTRPLDQLNQDLKQAREDYIACRAKIATRKKVTEQANEEDNSKNNNELIKYPTINNRSSYNSKTDQKYPWIRNDGSSSSAIQSNIHFIGFEKRKPSLSLGYQGWECGMNICKKLGQFDPKVVPVGWTRSPEEYSNRKYSNAILKNANTNVEKPDYKDISRMVFVASTMGTVALSFVLYRKIKLKK